MEQVGDMFEGEWASLSAMYTSTGESEFMTRLLSDLLPETEFGDSDESFATNDIPYYYNSVDFGFEDEENMSVTDQVCTDLMMLEDEGSSLFKKSSMFEAELAIHGNKLETQVFNDAKKGTKKRPDNSEDQKNKRNVKPRKSKKVAEVMQLDESNSGCGGLLTQTSSSNCLKNNANITSQTSMEECSNLTAEDSALPNGKGKTRANRGSATDPQSLYARKRREKINERLRILQALVPNGTKVDISTMLDEAVQYVKFLQLQIKLLSSDDMWMYAPLAYNGMDLGLDLKL